MLFSASSSVRLNAVTMKFSVLVVVLATLIKSNVAGPRRGLSVANEVQQDEVLKSGVQSPYQLAIDRDTNTLFFSYTSNEDNVFESVYINLKDKSSGIIPGVAGGFANAVDHQKQIVYIGGNDGIYKFDYGTKKAVKLDITTENIWQLFFKDGLYFTTYPDEKAYLYKDGAVKPVPALADTKAMLVGVDNNDNLFFSQDGELKRVVGGNIKSVGDYSVNGFNTDAEGNLYFSTPDGIFKLEEGAVKTVAAIEGVYGFAVESDGALVYAADSSVLRLRRAAPADDDDDVLLEVHGL